MTTPDVRTEHIGPTLVVSVAGDVDLSNVATVRARLLGALGDDVESLVVDLSDAGYVDSTGVRLLFDMAERFARNGQRVRTVIPEDALVRRVALLTNLDQVVDLYDTVPEALSSLESP
ncbi:MAG TPA: STAS domain-containing protein [Acidimicrobiia bacterium]|nr:STAS domain-containing protein [Acidimicrobiia bacterium]